MNNDKNLEYDNIDVNDIISNLKNNEIKINGLSKYLNNDILFDLSSGVWRSEVRDKIILQINKLQDELKEFNTIIGSITNDLENVQQIKKYNNEIKIIQRENEMLSLDESSNKTKITANNDIIENYNDIIASSNKQLEKWR